MNQFFAGLWLIVGLELRQRVRGLAWYVLLGVFAALVLIVTVLLVLTTNALGSSGGGGLFSTIVLFVLLLGMLVSPALSGAAINGEREQGTLATTQVTLITSAQLVLGKWVAAWATALAFLVVALPFLIFSVALGQMQASTVVSSVLVTAIELGVFAAIGVGLSGVVARPLFSVTIAYLVIAALSIGTLIAFGLGGIAMQTTVQQTYIGADWEQADESGEFAEGQIPCLPPVEHEYQQPRFDRVWGVLAANPFVVIADAAPVSFDDYGQPSDLFGFIAVGVRGAQEAPESEETIDECATLLREDVGAYDTPQDVYDRTTPSWFVGLAVHIVLGAGALFWATRRTKVPITRLPGGTRVA